MVTPMQLRSPAALPRCLILVAVYSPLCSCRYAFDHPVASYQGFIWSQFLYAWSSCIV